MSETGEKPGKTPLADDLDAYRAEAARKAQKEAELEAMRQRKAEEEFARQEREDQEALRLAAEKAEQERVEAENDFGRTRMYLAGTIYDEVDKVLEDCKLAGTTAGAREATLIMEDTRAQVLMRLEALKRGETDWRLNGSHDESTTQAASAAEPDHVEPRSEREQSDLEIANRQLKQQLDDATTKIQQQTETINGLEATNAGLTGQLEGARQQLDDHQQELTLFLAKNNLLHLWNDSPAEPDTATSGDTEPEKEEPQPDEDAAASGEPEVEHEPESTPDPTEEPGSLGIFNQPEEDSSSGDNRENEPESAAASGEQSQKTMKLKRKQSDILSRELRDIEKSIDRLKTPLVSKKIDGQESLVASIKDMRSKLGSIPEELSAQIARLENTAKGLKTDRTMTAIIGKADLSTIIAKIRQEAGLA